MNMGLEGLRERPSSLLLWAEIAVTWIRKVPSDLDQPRKVLQGLERAADM